MVNDGWVHDFIGLPHREAKRTGCHTCMLQLLRRLVQTGGGPPALIPFSAVYNNAGEHIFSAPWYTSICESYMHIVHGDHVVLLDFYSDDTKLSKSGTQGAIFIRVRFSNLRVHTESWCTVDIAPSSRAIETFLPDQKRWQLKLKLAQPFLFLLLKPLIEYSCKGTVLNGFTYFLLLAMFFADQSEERTIFSLKRSDYEIYCTHCVLRAPICGATHRQQTQGVLFLSDEHGTAPGRCRSVRNTVGRLSLTRHFEIPVSQCITNCLYHYQVPIAP